MAFTSEQMKEMFRALKERQAKARIVAYISMLLRIYELLVPIHIKSFSVESFDAILKFQLFQGTGTWILMRVLPLYITAKLIHTLYGDEFEQFHLWVLTEISYIFLHIISHIVISLLPNYRTHGLFSKESAIVYFYCSLRVLSVCVIDAYYKVIDDNEKMLAEALKPRTPPAALQEKNAFNYWQILSEIHSQRDQHEKNKRKKE